MPLGIRCAPTLCDSGLSAVLLGGLHVVPQTQLRGSAERSVWTGLSAGSETTTDQRLGLEQVTLWASASFREQDSDNPLQYEKEGSLFVCLQLPVPGLIFKSIWNFESDRKSSLSCGAGAWGPPEGCPPQRLTTGLKVGTPGPARGPGGTETSLPFLVKLESKVQHRPDPTGHFKLSNVRRSEEPPGLWPAGQK